MTRSASYYHAAKAEGGERWDRIRAAQRKSTAKRRERAHSSPRAWLEQNLRQIAGRCRRGGIEFNVTADDIELPTHCPILNMALNYQSSGRDDYCASIDRIEPWRGYVKGNCRVLSRKANRYRQDCTSSGVFSALADDARRLFGDR